MERWVSIVEGRLAYIRRTLYGALVALVSAGPAAAQTTTLVGNIATPTTVPMVSFNNCFYVGQGVSGSTGTDTKLCASTAAGWANAFGLAPITTIGSGLTLSSGVLAATGGGGTPGGSNQAAQINSSGSFGAIGPTASNLFGWNASGIATPIVLGTNLSLSGSTLNATGGSGTPGGSNGQIQYNNSGAFGGFTFSGGMTVTPSTGVVVLGNPGPSTLGGIESIAQAAGEFVQYIDTSGVPHLATPSGGGNFSGPGSAVSNDLVSFNGTSGTVGQDSGILSTNVVTAAATLTSNALTLGGGSKAVSVLGSLGTTTTLLHGNGAGPPSFGAVVLTTDVSGVLPLANGGSNAALTAAAGAVPYSTGSALALLAAGTSGQFLESQGAAPPIWGSPSGSGTVGSCSTADALAYYAATGTTTSCLAGVGTSGQVLTSNGTGVAPTFQAAGGFTAPTLSPGLATTPGTYNAGAQTLTSGSTLSPQIFYKAETSSCTLNSTCNSPSTNDTALLPTFTNASLTGTLPNPSTVGSGSYQIGYDGTHSYSVTTVGGTASIYGCGTPGTTVSGIAYQTQFVTDGTNYQCIPSGASSGSGVTSVGLTVPAASIFGVTGSPVTTSGNLGLTTTVTSGGVLYGSSGTQVASSGALTVNALVKGGGAGTAPSPSSVTDNGTIVNASAEPIQVAQAYSTPGALTDASTVAVNAALSNNFTLLMTSGIGATRALGNPSNLVAGQVLNFVVTQDPTGGRLLTFGSDYTGTIALNAGANAVTPFSCVANTSSTLQCAGGASITPAIAQSSPSNPTGTTSTTPVMMGLAGTLTPLYKTRMFVSIQGTIANSTISDGATVRCYFGTSTAPTNGAALTGTAIGSARTNSTLIAGAGVPFSCGGWVTGLTANTAYWIDAAVAAVTGGTASITAVDISANEF